MFFTVYTKVFSKNFVEGAQQVLTAQYHNLEDIETPVDIDALEFLLLDAGYDKQKSQFLINGFRNGFDLGYRGNQQVNLTAPNLKFVIGDETVLWNKVMQEVMLHRYAGPFDSIPFKHYIQSPIGLVPKDGGQKVKTNLSSLLPQKN